MSTFLPQLGASTQALIRSADGVLMIATLLQALPEARRFFVSDRWGGYAKSQPDVDLIQNPVVMPLVLAMWFAAAGALVFGWLAPWAAIVNLAFCRYFFIHMRWKGVLRGMGAPGFLAYWLAGAVCLLEVARHWAPSVLPLALITIQIDLAVIMLSAGVYKFTAGYPRNHGMELGLCNPMWGYWWRWYSVKPPDHWLFWTLNQLGWSTEVIAAVLMVVPATREIGGLFIVGIFLCIATQIRLGFLTEMVMACGLLYLSPDGTFGRVLEAWLPAAAPVAAVSYEPLGTVLQAGLVGYLLLLPLAHAGLYYNFYAGRVLPRPFQRALERYTNVFGIIIWRVFSVDIINFFVRLHRRGPQGDVPLRPLGSWPRFNHVGEMICLASLFTTLKYYPSDNAIFRERVVRYARTLPRERGERVVFEYVSVIKHADRFDWVPVGEFEVDPDAGSIAERWFDPSISPRSAHAVSPVHAGAVPGSYRPATS